MSSPAYLRPYLDNLWRWSCGLPEVSYPLHDYQDLEKTEWSEEFEGMMRRRLIIGACRYGLLGAPGKPQYDRLANIVKRVALYRSTGNREFLVDIANLALLEYVEGDHPEGHFCAHDDLAEAHAEVIG